VKLRLVTIGKPKLHYAHQGWNEYMWRLVKFHKISVKHLADKYANDVAKILEATEGTYRVALVIEGKRFTSRDLALFMKKRELDGKEVSFIVGGPEGLPPEVIKACNYQWSLSDLTFPHDLAMVILLEALYRASTINVGVPYHK
jgi:23S rRNA (pseudouridine1915-N3)-methyltransferase